MAQDFRVVSHRSFQHEQAAVDGGGGVRAQRTHASTMSSIGVYARIRPTATVDEGLQVIGSQGILVRNLEFSLDAVFDGHSSQEDVYSMAGRERVAKVMEGYNVCMIAYGQTGSGKTHTMFVRKIRGPNQTASRHSDHKPRASRHRDRVSHADCLRCAACVAAQGPDEVLAGWRQAPSDKHGLALRAMADLFDAAAAAAYVVRCSYLEVYNDACNDLLGSRQALPIREAPSRAPYVEGLAAEEVTCLDEAMVCLARGSAGRTTAQMSMNLRSSRSHAVFSLSVERRGGEAGEAASGKLVLVDLAGMESSKKSYAVEGASTAPQRREEAKHINTSLYALGTVIAHLSESGRRSMGVQGASHIPFRNSKLTRLLQSCLHGNSDAAFIVTLRAEPQNLDECAATLRFAQRARAVPVKVRPNVLAAAPDPTALKEELKAVTRELSNAKALIDKLQREMAAERTVKPSGGGVGGVGRGGGGGGRGGSGSGGRGGSGSGGGRVDGSGRGSRGDSGVQGSDRSPTRSMADEEAHEAMQSRLLAGRLQVGMLAEQMNELVEQTREAASSARELPAVAQAPASWLMMPWQTSPAPPAAHATTTPVSEPRAESADGSAAGSAESKIGGCGGHTHARGAADGTSSAPVPHARAVAVAHKAATDEETAAALEAARAEAEAARTSAADAVRRERAKAERAIKAAKAEAATAQEAREEERRVLREAAAQQAAKRTQQASRADAALHKAEQQARDAEARATAAERRLAEQEKRAERAEAAATAAREKAKATAREEAAAASKATGSPAQPSTAAAVIEGGPQAAALGAGQHDASAPVVPLRQDRVAPHPLQSPSSPLHSPASSHAARRLQRSQERATSRSPSARGPPPNGGGHGGVSGASNSGASGAPSSGGATSSTLYELEVPSGTAPGQKFIASLNGRLMSVVCPPGVLPGQTIRVAMPRNAAPAGPWVGGSDGAVGTRADGFPDDVDERAQAEAYRAYEAQRQQLGQLHSLARWGQSQVASMQESLNTMEGDPQQRHGRHQYPGHEGRAAPDLTPRTAAVIEASEREGTAMAQLGALFTLPQGELRAVLERMDWDVNAAASELIDVVGLSH